MIEHVVPSPGPPASAAATSASVDIVDRSTLSVSLAPLALQIDTMPLTWGDRLWIRISGQVYNDPSDYEALAEALPAVLD